MKKKIEILVRGVCVRNRRLLICRNRHRGNLYLPGGHVEFNESAPEALRREIHEEMGVPCTIGRFLGVVEHTFKDGKRRTCEINLVFQMDLKLGPRDPTDLAREDQLDFTWVPLARIGRYTLEPKVLRDHLSTWLRRSGAVAGWASTYDGQTSEPAGDICETNWI